MSKTDKLANKIHAMRDNAIKFYAFLIAKEKEEIKKNVEIRKQLEGERKETAAGLSRIDENVNKEVYNELMAKLQIINTRIQLTEETIAQLQLNLSEMNMSTQEDKQA